MSDNKDQGNMTVRQELEDELFCYGWHDGVLDEAAEQLLEYMGRNIASLRSAEPGNLSKHISSREDFEVLFEELLVALVRTTANFMDENDITAQSIARAMEAGREGDEEDDEEDEEDEE